MPFAAWRSETSQLPVLTAERLQHVCLRQHRGWHSWMVVPAMPWPPMNAHAMSLSGQVNTPACAIHQVADVVRLLVARPQ
jgi:hypothetical protein